MHVQTLGDRWGAETSPSGFDLIYAQQAEEIAPGIVDYANQIRLFGESLIDSISRARMSLAMSDQQRALLDVQLQRAQLGLPPIQTGQYGVVGGSTVDSKMVLLALAGIALILLMRRN